MCKHKCHGSETEKATGLHPLIGCLWTGGAKLMRVRAPGPNHRCSASRNSLFFGDRRQKCHPAAPWGKRGASIGQRGGHGSAPDHRGGWQLPAGASGGLGSEHEAPPPEEGQACPAIKKPTLPLTIGISSPLNIVFLYKIFGGKLPMILDLWIQSHWL